VGRRFAGDYAAVHGHFVPPASAVWGGDGFPIRVWAKNLRASGKKTQKNAARRAPGETSISSAGELSPSRLEALEEIDPGWCPEWDISWARCHRMLLRHIQAGGTLPTKTSELVIQGGDLGIWIAAQTAGSDKLTPDQRYLLESLGVDPEHGPELRPVRKSQDVLWERNMTTARQFHARQGHERSDPEQLPVDVFAVLAGYAQALDGSVGVVARLPADTTEIQGVMSSAGKRL
jgi:hypothetical protein